ncbi:DNA-binding protein involved in single-strand DNA break repair [Seminavis robusta]|uniref:DNA-binding protein involved in single-strand DNA break repair n=1 Tax=Seminavis robusta TaxID=568900 RepID=A0A9N8HUT8_9STRA|nr:DNA-binding protein involved in single-strand DNA break repair [Seminavis robusta]|eukprot:Sro1873_g302880.1 DNA-binding protein involved in single-strand DNA break repair (231) ;mRNA; f:6317-7009
MPRSAHSALGNKKKSVSSSSSSSNDSMNGPAKRHKNNRNHWADGLLKFLDDPTDPAVVYLDDEFIAVKDKFPKAKCHYLVMPRDTKFRSLNDLEGRGDMVLLRKMEAVANKLVHDQNETGDPTLQFRYGFHAVPSLNHLHMHVISQDFDSPHLKNKKHWNSFTTTFFVPVEEMQIAVTKGKIDFTYRENRLKDGLKCHRCGKMQTNMPQLKQHISCCNYDATKEFDEYSD